MSIQIDNLLRQYVEGIRSIYGTSLNAVILYGSYARGDFTADSDVDIMILVNLSEEEIRESREQVSNYTYDFNWEHDVVIMPIVKEVSHFNYWVSAYPFYRNVQKEGVRLYAS